MQQKKEDYRGIEMKRQKQQSKARKIFESIILIGAILIIGFASVFIMSKNYSLIYNGLSDLTKVFTKMDLNQTVDWFRGGK